MMRLNLFQLVFLVPCLTSPALGQEVSRLGTAILNGDEPRVEFSSDDFGRIGEPLVLILPDLSNPGDFRITETVLGSPKPDLDLAARGTTAFEVPAVPDAPSIGFALAGPPRDIAVVGGALRVDVTGDGVAETLSACLTMEAVQLRAMSDAGEEVWQDYLPLGYDVEPTCP